ncbi:MAG TPA: phytanoyl-CoA dioxygenase family protein [Stellaceae bacterium]|nr:phytanoyl-CoA dioxygenase family protein [Stellaceae bacterium]
MLTQDQIAHYRRDGFSFPHAALSAAEMDDCRAGLARYEEWLGGPVNAADRRWRSAAYVFLPWYDRLIRHPRILDAVEDLIGPNILVYTATFFIKEARSPTFAAWHQDATYFGLTPHEHVTAWVALADASELAGCMEVAPSRGARRGSSATPRSASKTASTVVARRSSSASTTAAR